jgi:hypothetical protein
MDDDAVEAVVYKNEQVAKELGEQFHRNIHSTPWRRETVGRRTIRRGPGKQRLAGKDFCLADEVRYIQRRAAERDGRFVSIGSLALFSTETGDAWLLDPADHLAARLARDGDPEPIDIEETDSNFAIGWKGNYGIEGEAFVSIDRDSGRVVTILGYATDQIAELG